MARAKLRCIAGWELKSSYQEKGLQSSTFGGGREQI